MNRWWRPLLALAGTILLITIVRMIGVPVIVAGLRRAGWVIVPILLLQGVAYLLNAWAWWRILPPEPGRPRFASIARISVIGFAMNFVTPVVNAGGEPYRIAALTPRLGLRRATASVLAYVMIHAISSLLLWLGALGLTLWWLPQSGLARPTLIGAFLLVAAALVVVVSGGRHGVVRHVARLLAQFRLRRVSSWLDRRREGIAAIDGELIQLWRDRPRHVVAAVAIDGVSRLVAALEFVLLGAALGIPIGYGTAVLMWGLLALAMNIFFLFPWELGSREGSLYFVTRLAGLPSDVAGLAVVASRARELFWAALGMALLWYESRLSPTER
jgi:uncharacterized membrane protein YbhN (UPF0104 family)